jgi:2',3'-cyclic-nucleotide 2'-phosphodiesterase (5'-nucleotidase family)
VDSGDLLWKSSFLASNEVEQRKLKANLLFEAMAALQLDALTPGEGDLIFGLDFLIEGVRKHRLPYVSANLRRADDSALFPAFVVVERAGLRIGITGVTAPALLGEGIKTAPLEDSLRGVIEQLRGREAVDLVVLLSHQGTEADNALVRTLPGIDLVFSGHDRRFQVDPKVIGNTALFQAGSRGKYLGQVEIGCSRRRPRRLHRDTVGGQVRH